ncbi:hypothetical protein [Moraxella oculi]|uniref:DUF4440 domain-containing protein n=1 Tax=Moraxella oculi TaxID=2940516 RepID=A0ABW8U9T2_9GAMM
MIQKNTNNLIKKSLLASTLATTIGVLSKLTARRWVYPMASALSLACVAMPAHAISESSVQNYAAAMKKAANGQNIGQVSRLIADDAIIKMTRNGNSADLGKNAYLQYLQKNWGKAKDYRYDIQISDVVIVGNQARAQVSTTETWYQDSRPVKLITISKVTLADSDNNTVLLRSSAQVSIN